METYRLSVDRKYTIWEREYYMIEAESETEALEKCLSPDAQEVALECIRKYADLVAGNCAFQGNNIWDSTCGSTRARGYKALWLVDVDNPNELSQVKELILQCKHSEPFVMYEVPTVHGYHLVCSGFNSLQFNEEIQNRGLDKVDIHKNNPTLLYYNDLSSKQK